jgi:shikimate dehydrogenase
MTKKKFSVLGDPIEHSLSPLIHLAAYKQLGLDWGYERTQVHSGQLNNFTSARGLVFSGFSVTMPLKAEAAALAVRSDDLVKQLGIANTLLRTANGLEAFNTDVFGITKALESCWLSKPQIVALLGAGATARSALLSIQQNAPSAKVSVYVRSSTNANAIVELAKNLGVSLTVRPIEDFAQAQELTINTIPGNKLPVNAGKQQGWLLDVNYSNPDEEFHDHFDSAKVVSGKAMLLWQAIAQIRLFLNLDASTELPHESDVLRAMSASL